MPNFEIAHHRLHNEYLSRPILPTAADAVGWLGAVQSQDYAGALWAVALRTPGLTQAELNRAFDAGEILRTHIMRPTWHFVTPVDIRWMEMLTAPRVQQFLAYHYRQFGLDADILVRATDVIAKTLEGGNHLTRTEVGVALNQTGIETGSALRLSFIMNYAELVSVICSGVRKGKQQTYALMDERAAITPMISREEALAELVKRYFTSHGPATVHDFAWWSGLTVGDAKAGVEMVKASLESIVSEGKTYWFSPSTAPVLRDPSPKVCLLPNFDEYTVSYKDRSDMIASQDIPKLDSLDNTIFADVIVLDSQIIGTWAKTIKKHEIQVKVKPIMTLTDVQNQAVCEAVQRYADFLGLTLVLS